MLQCYNVTMTCEGVGLVSSDKLMITVATPLRITVTVLCDNITATVSFYV